MATQWISEACDLKPDPVSGAKICRLTSAPAINTNIYCEQPYNSPDGRRIAIHRSVGLAPDYQTAIYVADLEAIKITCIRGCTGGNNSSWGEWFYYLGDNNALMAVSLMTFEQKVVLSDYEAPGRRIGAISPDQKLMVYSTVLPGPTIGLVRVDLETGDWKVIFEHPEIVNPHLQFNPVTGADIMVQHNRGSRMATDGTVVNYDSSKTTTLFVIDKDGRNQRPVPAGPPWTGSCTGHECFVADTGRVAFTAHWNWQTGEFHPSCTEGNLFTARPGDEKPTVFPTPNHRFNHLCVSRCGRYFVCDCYGRGITEPTALVIGNFETGKHRTLLQDCQSSGGGAQYTHAHAYLTADNRHVIYNADPRGITHVFKAELPDDFLANLD